jgi:hypothetical protein
MLVLGSYPLDHPVWKVLLPSNRSNRLFTGPLVSSNLPPSARSSFSRAGRSKERCCHELVCQISAKPTIETGIKAMTLAVLSAFDQHARGK